MTETLTRDADTLHRALAASGGEVRVTVSRATAEWMAELIDARVSGHDVVLTNTREEVTPSQAQVRRLMDESKLDFRKVGTHHRITVASIRSFLESERERRGPLLAELAALQNQAGLVE